MVLLAVVLLAGPAQAWITWGDILKWNLVRETDADYTNALVLAEGAASAANLLITSNTFVSADAVLQGQVTTNAADFQSLETNVYTISEADALLDGKVSTNSPAYTNAVALAGNAVADIDGSASNLELTGTVKLEETGVSTNYLSKVYIGGQLVITEVYNGTTNTYYDFTD